MYQKYQTEALVLGSRERGESDRIFSLYTKDFGLVQARASAVRTERSRMRYALQHYSHAHVALVRGKRGWRLGGATVLGEWMALEGAVTFARTVRLVLRLVAGEERNDYLFAALSEARSALSKSSQEMFPTIEIVCVARILFALGYLSSEALQTTLFAHAAYTERDLAEATVLREKLLTSINRAISESHREWYHGDMEEVESSHDEEKIERLRRAMYSRELSEKLKDRPRRQMEEIRPIVGDDWRREEPVLPSSMVAPRTIGVARKALWWLLGIAALFFVAALLYFGYYFTFGGGASPASPGNIDIVISGPPQISGGDPTQLQIVVTNRNQVPLQLADLVITYPPGTRSPTDLSTDLSSQRISLGTIEAGGRRQGTVTAIFAGSGGAAGVKVDLEYRISGSSAIFVASSNYQAQLSSSPLTLTVSSNRETVSGQPVEFTITIASNANTTVKDVLLSASYPFGFMFASGNPKPARGSTWELGDIRPGEKREVTLRGTLVGESGDERVFRFSTGTRKEPNNEAITTTLVESAFRMKVTDTFLGLGITVNKAGANVVISPGGQVNVAINWQNNLSTAIQDAIIVARLTGLTIDGTTMLSPDGFFRSSDGVVLWDKTTTKGALGNLAAGARGSVSFSFQVPSADALKNVRNPSLTITVNAAGKRISEDGVPENLQAASSQRVAVSSALVVTAQGLYYANPFGSVGPLPPKANTETTYAIIFTITNTTNKIDEAILTATLPPYVRWVGIYSPASEAVSFNQSAGTVAWDIGTIEEELGVDGTSPRQAAVAIGFTPSTSQIGQEPSLLRDIVLIGLDSATGQTITKRLDDVTSDLIRVSRSEEGIPAAPDPGFSSTQGTVVR